MVWTDDHARDLPDFWYESRSERLKKDYRQHVPHLLKVAANGTVGGEDAPEVWFEQRPFLLCLRCGAAFDRTERNEFKKLSRLSNAGRSTATTVVSGSAIVQLREDRQVQPEAQKLMSFTDNRQDASLQAGHFNDFIQVGLLRAALFKALQERQALEHFNVTQAVFTAMGLDQKLYAKEPAQYGPGKTRNEESLQRLLEYRLYEDLRRGWRVAQPNLEQCGLLVIDYPALHEMCEASEPWAVHPLLQQATPVTRERVVRAFLDFLRKEMAIDAKVLDAEEQKELRRRVEQNLRDPWALDDFDHLLESAIFLLPPGRPNSGKERSLDPARSKLGKYLRQRSLWGLPNDITAHDGETLIRELISILRGNYLSGGKRDDRSRAAAEVATKLFGTTIPPENVVDESLRRAILVPAPDTPAQLRTAIEAPLPSQDLNTFIQSPLAAWTENVFGLDEEDGRLVRRKPISFKEGARQLAEQCNVDERTCTDRLRQLLALGNTLRNDMGEPVFAFRLHQFLAAGGTMYATLEDADKRHLTLEGQHYAPGEGGERLLFPLVFCRECGQEYYMVSWAGGEAGNITPRLPFLTSDEDDAADSRQGYVALNVSEDGPLRE